MLCKHIPGIGEYIVLWVQCGFRLVPGMYHYVSLYIAMHYYVLLCPPHWSNDGAQLRRRCARPTLRSTVPYRYRSALLACVSGVFRWRRSGPLQRTAEREGTGCFPRPERGQRNQKDGHVYQLASGWPDEDRCLLQVRTSCSTMQYHAIPCNGLQYGAIPCNNIQYQYIAIGCSSSRG